VTQAANLRDFARLLGGELVGRKILCPGPGHTRHDRSLAVTFAASAPDGFSVHSFAGDDWQLCKDHVRSALGIRRERVEVVHAERDDMDEQQRVRIALRIWDETRTARGTIVETYLLSRRIRFPDYAVDLRYHPGLKYDERRLPAMVCLFRDILTDVPCGIHRTFLDPVKVSKVDRRMLGRAKGAAIKLDPDDEVTQGLCLGEGVETCLHGRQELGLAPTWALGSAAALEHFPVLSGVTAMTFLGEHDKTGANAKAIKAAGRRMVANGIEATAKVPDFGDLNDGEVISA